MILQKNSIIRYLPLINKKQLLVLDSIRFTIEMIEYSYNNLEKRILELSKESTEKDYPSLFLYCWTILDNARRLIRLYKIMPSNSGHQNIELIEYVNSSRNTYQHLDERIDESLIDSNQPFYGTLKWSYSNIETGKTENFIALSGIHYTDRNEFTIGKFDESAIIQNLILETVDKKNKIEINISQFMIDLKQVVKQLEEDLEKQFSNQNLQLLDWRSRRDILFRFKSE